MDRIARGDDGGARDFFDRYARDFDHIYDEGGKGALARFVDTKLRSEMRVRFEKTFEALTPLRGRSLLDAGCGGGRYVIPAAKAGASEVLGIDFSETMLALGRQKAAAEGVGDVCRFEVGCGLGLTAAGLGALLLMARCVALAGVPASFYRFL